MKFQMLSKSLLLITIVAGISVPRSYAQIEPSARDLAQAVTAKLGSAQTLRVTARHRLDPILGVGAKHEKGPIKITVQRPNKFYALQSAGSDTREIAFDGKFLCMIHPEMKHHALEALTAGSIAQFADRVDERFGFRPPVAELLAADVSSQLFRDVTSARVTGRENVGWTRCERLHFEQPGMTGDLWVGVRDKLPRRYLLTFTDIQGHPTWEIRFSKWELNSPVETGIFSKRPAADSNRVPMVKSR